MLLVKNILFETVNAEMKLNVLFDSGATHSFIRRDLAEKLGGITPLKNPVEAVLADGVHTLQIKELITPTFYIDNVALYHHFLVSDHLDAEVVFGAWAMQEFHLKLDFKEHTVHSEDPRIGLIRL